MLQLNILWRYSDSITALFWHHPPILSNSGWNFWAGTPIGARRDVRVLLLLLQHGGGVQCGSSGQLLPGEVVCYFESIVSTSCGSGVIGAGCCRLDRVERRGGKSAGEEGKWPDSLCNSGRSAAWLTRSPILFLFFFIDELFVLTCAKLGLD